MDIVILVVCMMTITGLLDRLVYEALKMRINKMNSALEALKAQVAAIDARDDQIVQLVGELRGQVSTLTDLLASRPQDTELQELADTLAGTVGKLDGVLAPPPPAADAPQPADPSAG